MPKTVINEEFDGNQRATISISMTCKDWVQVGSALSGIRGTVFQTAADAILAGLVSLGYFTVR